MGEQFGNYEIIRRLAAGGMAEVLLAKQRSVGGFERLVCLKRILPHLSKQEDFLKMFQDEARIAANLIHPNIAQIYDIAVEQGRYYIAMEYVRGEDLRRVYNQEVGRGTAISRPIAAQVAMGAAAGLEYAHRQQSLDGQPLEIVHRDINPQNILVTYDGFVKLIDFGVAKAAGKLLQTRSGVLKGKYSYMSPEQASGDPVDGRTDIFALGVTLYEITTGVRLFKRENELETLHAVIACNVAPPCDLIGDYEPALQAIIMKALAYDPQDRYHTAGEMQSELETFLQKAGHPTSAAALATFMHDTFAEKLADEAVSGAPPWNEPATHSRAVAAQRKRRQDRQAPRPQKTAAPVETLPPEPTSADAPAGDWQLEDEPQERTVSTHAPGQPQGPPSPGEVTPWRLDGPAAAAPTQVVPQAAAPRRTWLRWVLLAMLGGGAIARQALRPAPPPPATAPAAAPVAAAPRGDDVSHGTPAAPTEGPQLQVTAPFAVQLSLAGKSIGVTPLRHPIKRPGTYRLVGESRAFGAVLQRRVRLGEHLTQVDLAEPSGQLSIEAKPWAWLQLGQQTPQQTPARYVLPVGTYAVTFECPDGRRREMRVAVAADQEARAAVDCGTGP